MSRPPIDNSTNALCAEAIDLDESEAPLMSQINEC